jgi:hypothetical protein
MTVEAKGLSGATYFEDWIYIKHGANNKTNSKYTQTRIHNFIPFRKSISTLISP